MKMMWFTLWSEPAGVGVGEGEAEGELLVLAPSPWQLVSIVSNSTAKIVANVSLLS